MCEQILILGNWKMNGSCDDNHELLTGLLQYKGPAQLGVFPPFPYLAQANSILKGSDVHWGAQTCSTQTSGAFTGEVSTQMLSDLGAKWCLAGHSERRAMYGESDEVVALKTQAILMQGLTPVICIGETLEQRQNNETDRVLKQQIDAIFRVNPPGSLTKAVIAYEPVWAIGTGMAATPQQAQQAHAYIQSVLVQHDPRLAECAILYGGSMKPDNAAELLSQPNIDGGLIGGASLNAEDFLAIASCII